MTPLELLVQKEDSNFELKRQFKLEDITLTLRDVALLFGDFQVIDKGILFKYKQIRKFTMI